MQPYACDRHLAYMELAATLAKMFATIRIAIIAWNVFGRTKGKRSRRHRKTSTSKVDVFDEDSSLRTVRRTQRDR